MNLISFGRKVAAGLSLLALGLCLTGLGGRASAAEKPLVVDWTPALYTTTQDGRDMLDTGSTKKKIQEAFTNRLRELQDAGKLPFKVNFGSSVRLSQVQEDFSDRQPIGLIPLVTVAKGVQTSYPVGDKKIYKDTVISSVNVAICSAGTEGDHSWRVLAVVPLTGYKTIGADIRHPLFTRPSLQQEAEVFADITKTLIGRMDFQSVSKVLKDWQKDQLTPETWQVEDMDISSAGARQVFQGDGVALRNIICNYYAANFQKATGHVVLPTDIQNAFRQKAGANLSAGMLRSLDGSEIELEVPEAAHKIRLDLYGINSGIVPRHKESYMRKDVLYKAWLRSTNLDSGKKLEDTHYAVEAMSKDYGDARAAAKVDEKGIYTEVLLTLSERLAQKNKD